MKEAVKGVDHVIHPSRVSHRMKKPGHGPGDESVRGRERAMMRCSSGQQSEERWT